MDPILVAASFLLQFPQREPLLKGRQPSEEDLRKLSQIKTPADLDRLLTPQEISLLAAAYSLRFFR